MRHGLPTRLVCPAVNGVYRVSIFGKRVCERERLGVCSPQSEEFQTVPQGK